MARTASCLACTGASGRRVLLRGAVRSHADHPVRGLEINPGTMISGSAEHHRSTEEIEGVEWTGRDRHNRLVFATRGCIFWRTGGEDRLLADFNALVPNAAAPPSDVSFSLFSATSR